MCIIARIRVRVRLRSRVRVRDVYDRGDLACVCHIVCLFTSLSTCVILSVCTPVCAHMSYTETVLFVHDRENLGHVW